MNDGRGLATVNPDFQIVMREMAYPYFETISEMACLRMNDDVDIDIQHYERIRVEHAQALLDSRLWRSRYGRMPDDWGKMTHSLRREGACAFPFHPVPSSHLHMLSPMQCRT